MKENITKAHDLRKLSYHSCKLSYLPAKVNKSI